MLGVWLPCSHLQPISFHADIPSNTAVNWLLETADMQLLGLKMTELALGISVDSSARESE